ncbi:uncharacterized protein LOC108891257 isoform X16 [Lates calcarifer]|uniref:Uncharacterized protein LOC108891257 isoform X15 n=1 Tax=Lates calcarifer TaxID=8187 RepID=A0AAJ8DNR3_LATCA|nr:uncharacterized protein LOC108891257 isoform X15 [Lates calcarifer]XP_050925541.1 uncharacterized protein LOC108891257 isoform X16 [Lates calcarifer]
MRVNIYSCLFVFVLGCNVTAGPMRGIPPPPTTMTSHPPTTTPSTPLKNTGMKYKILKEKGSITLCCPQPVEGKVTWSRVNEGKVDILTVDGEGEKEHTDKCSSSSTHESLHIKRAAVSDSGCYLCNNETVVQLFVIPSGIQRKVRKQRESITLHCPQPVEGKVTWSRVTEQQGKVDILTVDGDGQKVLIDDQDRRYGSSDKSLHINRLSVSDSGNYFCNNEPAVLLSVIPSGSRGRTPPTTATTALSSPLETTVSSTQSTTKQPSTTYQKQFLGLVLGIASTFLLLFLGIIVMFFTERCRRKKQGAEERHRVYEEIQDKVMCQPTHGAYSLATFPGGSDHSDHMYSNICCNSPQTRIKAVKTEAPHHVIRNPNSGGNNKSC